MAKSLFNTPSADDIDHIADFAELKCLRDGPELSQRAVLAALSRACDEDLDDGIEDESSRALSRPVEAAFSELGRRSVFCGSTGYPFDVNGDVMTLKSDAWIDPAKTAYLFMLLATRENMKANRVVSVDGRDLDGTVLFEQLCGYVSHRLLTGAVCDEHAGFLVVGTARNSGGHIRTFEDCIESMCKVMNEGGAFRKRNPKAEPNDGGADVFSWRNFADQKEGALSLLGQCKTGTCWDHGDIASLTAEDFFENWTTSQPVVMPIVAFFVSTTCHHKWDFHRRRKTLLLERCRITQYTTPYWWETIEGLEATTESREDRSREFQSLCRQIRDWSLAILEQATK